MEKEKEEIVGKTMVAGRAKREGGGGGRGASVCRGRAWVSMFRRQLPSCDLSSLPMLTLLIPTEGSAPPGALRL